MGDLPWDEYPRPSLAVDVVVLTVSPGVNRPTLALLVIRRTSFEKGTWDIPGAFLLEHETAPQAVRRTLKEKAGVHDLEPQLLAVFDDPRRDPRGWVVSLAHATFVAYEQLAPALDAGEAALAPIQSPGQRPLQIMLPDSQASLPFDHSAMVTQAVGTLQARYDLGTRIPQPDPEGLMTHSPFTLTELRHLYESIRGHGIQRDAFARRFDPALSETTTLRATGQVGTRGRPARAFEKEGPEPLRRI